jgi:tetratricopeptide (TPR) repeat protein
MHAADDAASLLPRLERAVVENPGIPDVHVMLGFALLAAGRTREAKASFERALALRPGFAPALDGLGTLLQRDERYEDALHFHDLAVASDPRSGRAHHNRGNALLCLGRFQEARVAFERSLDLDETLAESHNGLGAALQEMGYTEDAIASYRTAIACKPEYGDPACNLGTILREAGDLQEAISWFERAVAVDPKRGRFHRYLVDSRTEVDLEHLRAMEHLSLAAETLPVDDRIELHFALGKSYADVGRIDDAFAQFRDGNALKRSTIDYDERTYFNFLRGVRDSFTEPFLDTFRGSGDPSHRPVFIVGVPRSGTTLVEQILAAHPAVRAMGELDAFASAFAELPQVGAQPSTEAVRASLRDLGERYLAATQDTAHGGERAVDKGLGNFRYVPLIHLAFPNARIIDVRRDLLDTCWSCYATLFANPIPFAFDLTELGHVGAAYEWFMDGWSALLPPERLMQVGYERLVDDFEAEARRIVAFCGLPWDAACLDFHLVRRPIRTASHSQVRRPLYRDSVGRSRPFAPYLGPLRDAIAEAPRFYNP